MLMSPPLRDRPLLGLSSSACFVLACLLLVSLGAAISRSLGEQNALPHWVALALNSGLTVLLAISVLWVGISPSRALYFLGASTALGVFPRLPGMAFLQDFTHLFILVAAAACWRVRRLPILPCLIVSPQVFIFVFTLLCTVSVILNFLVFQSVWQVKVGISQLINLSAFCWLVLEIGAANSENEDFVSKLLVGFLHGAAMLSAVGVVAIGLLIVTPYSRGNNGMGNYTIWGLGYFDRMQLMFDGPTTAGVYFTVVLGLAIYVRSTRQPCLTLLTGWLCQLSPWLIMASGSRVARMAMVLTLVTGLVNPVLRIVSAKTLVSSILALLIAFNYQSLPAALLHAVYCVSTEVPNTSIHISTKDSISQLQGMSLKGRFFKDHERENMIWTTLAFFQAAPAWCKWLGHGLGVAGFRTSGFPTPHQEPLDILVENGILGLLAYGGFLLASLGHLFRQARKNGPQARALAWTIGTLFGTMGIYAMAYEIAFRGICLFVLVLTIAVLRRSQLERV